MFARRTEHETMGAGRTRGRLGGLIARCMAAVAPRRQRARASAVDTDYVRIGALTEGSASGVSTQLVHHVFAAASGNRGALYVQNTETADGILVESSTTASPITAYAVRASGVTAGGVLGSSRDAVGVLGSSQNSYGVYGQSVNNVGAYGGTGSSTYGVVGTSTGGGIGVFGSSTGSLGNHGVFGIATVAPYGGVYGVTTTAGCVGTYGSTVNPATGLNTATAYAGYFDGNFVAIHGGKSAAVPTADGTYRLMYCMESPESWFEDFGAAALAGGAVTLPLDPVFASTVHLTDYHVFVTAQGESNGLYVADQTPTEFSVREQQGGKSTLIFSYRVVARRKDIDAPRLAPFTPLRPAPPPPIPSIG